MPMALRGFLYLERLNMNGKLGRHRKGTFTKPKKQPKVYFMQSKFDSRCSTCNDVIEKGRHMRWNRITKQAMHAGCPDPS